MESVFHQIRPNLELEGFERLKWAQMKDNKMESDLVAFNCLLSNSRAGSIKRGKHSRRDSNNVLALLLGPIKYVNSVHIFQE